jgi:putative nucleotidyltransferase with HDIG domain
VRRASELIQGVRGLATLPDIYLRLSDVVNNPRSSAADVGRVIADDPGLTARLLKLVNSAMYGFPSRIESVSEAIGIVGTAQLQDLALATAVIRAFADMPGSLVSMESFWRHSVACAVSARLLAARRGEPNVERHFVAGLLHDIGRPILYLQMPEDSSRALDRSRRSGEPLFREEYQVFGFDHTHVGGALLQAWRLPHSLHEAVLHHHAPHNARRYPIEAAVVHVADLLANALELGSSGEHGVPPLESAAWDRLQLPVSFIPELLAEAEEHYDEAVAILALDQAA